MELDRREFLKLSATGTGAAVALYFLGDNKALAAPREFPLKKKVKESTTICCYCGVVCGAIVTSYEDGIVLSIRICYHPRDWENER